MIPLDVPAAWRSLITRMTLRDPVGRPSAAEVAAELAAASSTGAPSGPWQGDAEATGAWELTGELPLDRTGSTTSVVQTGAAAPRRRRWWWVAALVAVLAVVLAGVLVVRGNAAKKDPQPDLPSGVPTRLQQPLSDLHDAVEGHHR